MVVIDEDLHRAGDRPEFCIALALMLACGIVSCATTGDPSAAKTEPRAAKDAPMATARLQFPGEGAYFGTARFEPYDGGVVAMINVWPGMSGRWRAVIHANGNCSSPNLFSAGPPLPLAGTSAPIVIPIIANPDGHGATTMRMPGVALDGPNGIRGKSVVVHAGASGPLDTEPGVRNDRWGCGVIETGQPLF